MNKAGCLMALLMVGALGALSACSEKEKPAEVAAASQPVAAPAPAPATPAANTEANATANVAGESVFKKTCALCHQSGIGGAPIPGKKEDWSPRVAQGEDTLFKHAIEGFNGEKGAMPAKGGNPALSDDDIKSAVRFMVSK